MKKLNKEEIINEVQRLLLKNKYGVKSIYKISKYIELNLQTPEEEFKETKGSRI